MTQVSWSSGKQLHLYKRSVSHRASQALGVGRRRRGSGSHPSAASTSPGPQRVQRSRDMSAREVAVRGSRPARAPVESVGVNGAARAGVCAAQERASARPTVRPSANISTASVSTATTSSITITSSGSAIARTLRRGPTSPGSGCPARSRGCPLMPMCAHHWRDRDPGCECPEEALRASMDEVLSGLSAWVTGGSYCVTRERWSARDVRHSRHIAMWQPLLEALDRGCGSARVAASATDALAVGLPQRAGAFGGVLALTLDEHRTYRLLLDLGAEHALIDPVAVCE